MNESRTRLKAIPSLPNTREGEGAEAERRREGGDDGGDQVGGRDQGAQHRGQDQADDEQDQRHDQLRVAGVGLLDVVVLGRDAAEQAAGGDLVQAFADLLDRVGGLARVGVAAEDRRRPRSRRCRRSAAPAAPAAPCRALPSRRRPRPPRRPRRPRSAASRSRAGSVRSSTSVPRLELVGVGLALAEPDRAVVGEVAEREHEQAGEDERR